MTGCYGDDPEDRYFERMLFEYLDLDELDDTGELFCMTRREREAERRAEAAEYRADSKRDEKCD